MSDYNAAGRIVYLLRKLQEGSTHSSLAAGFGLMGMNMPEGTYKQVMLVIAGLHVVLGIFFDEYRPEGR